MGIQITILLVILFLSGCTALTPVKEPEEVKKNRFNGNSTALHIRSMWTICSVKYASYRIPALVYTPICDCSVDYMRKSYSPEEVLNLSDNESRRIGPIISELCNNNPKPIPTTL